jgi:hypothetical protein
MILLTTGSDKYEPEENHADMINVKLLSGADKFMLITRWGVK